MSREDGAPPETFAEAHQRLVRTADFWHEWLGRGKFPDHPWRKYLQRSALTLKGLIYAPTGALLAAATSSLPETPGGERNYDYRYTWLRDSTYMLWGLYTLGLDREANDFFYFITDLAEQEPDLQIMYGIGTDATRVTFRAVDAYGNQRPHVTGDIRLSLTGPARLIGDNPFPFGNYGGAGGAFLRSIPGRTGTVTVTASHPILGSSTIRLTAIMGPAPGALFA